MYISYMCIFSIYIQVGKTLHTFTGREIEKQPGRRPERGREGGREGGRGGRRGTGKGRGRREREKQTCSAA